MSTLFDPAATEPAEEGKPVCYFCRCPYSSAVNANHWDGERWVRVDVCGDPACRRRIAGKPRRPRRPRQPVMVDAGGWAAVEGLNRIMARKGKP